MNENKTMEHLELAPKSGNKLENIFLVILVFCLISAIAIHITEFNPFISQLNQGTKIVGTIIDSKNEVKIKKYGEIIWTESDGNIYENSQLMTGNNSSAQLQIDDQVVSVASNTIIEFKKKDTLNTLIDIQEGDIGVKGHTNKVSYTVNNQNIESKDKKSSFSLSTNKGLEKGAGEVLIKKVEVIKPQIVLPPPPKNSNLILISPKSGEVFEGLKNNVEFAWTGNERKSVTLEINKDPKFEKTPLYRKKTRLLRQKIPLEAQGNIYWRIWLGEKTQDAPFDSFTFKTQGKADLILAKKPVLGKNNFVEVTHSSDEPIYLERSKSKDFKKIEKRLEIKEKSQKIRLNYLGQQFIRLVNKSNKVLAPSVPFAISPNKRNAELSYIQNKNILSLKWADQLKQIPESFYLLTLSDSNTTKTIESISPTAEIELPKSGEYQASLYAKEKGTKGLLLSSKKIQYTRIVKKAPPKKPKALKLKKEIIIK